MIIRLAAPVKVQMDGRFVKLPAGTMVNYSSYSRDGVMVHKFTYLDMNTCRTAEYIEAGHDRPRWL